MTLVDVVCKGRRPAAELGSKSPDEAPCDVDFGFEVVVDSVGGAAEGSGLLEDAYVSSSGGVRRWFGVVESEVSREEASDVPESGKFSLFCAASSAASFRETADGFLRPVLKVNLDRGANVARVSLNLSCNALIA